MLLERLPRWTGWLLLAVGAGFLTGGAWLAVPAAPAGIWIAGGHLLYLAGFAGWLLAGRLNYKVEMALRLALSLAIWLLLLETVTRTTPHERALAGGFTVLLAGTYLVQVGLFKLAGGSHS